MSESNDILLAKWLSGEITPEEKLLLEKEFDLDDLQNQLDLQDQYVPTINDPEELWLKVKSAKDQKTNTPQQHTTSQPNRRVMIAILALVLLGLLTAVIFLLFPSQKTIQTTNSPATEQFFADGTKLTISPYSTISYNNGKWDEARNVTLKGQAFFEVVKGAPFTVTTEAGKVEVLGTQFDVWNIDDKYMRVSCKEGKVRVTDKTGVSKTIIKSQYVYIVDNKIQEIQQVNRVIVDWQQNSRNYETTPIAIVLSDLERFYEVEFSADQSIRGDLFTGVLPINDLEKCVQFLETSLSYEANQQSDKVSFTPAN